MHEAKLIEPSLVTKSERDIHAYDYAPTNPLFASACYSVHRACDAETTSSNAWNGVPVQKHRTEVEINWVSTT